jgi:hypothetical protein
MLRHEGITAVRAWIELRLGKHGSRRRLRLAGRVQGILPKSNRHRRDRSLKAGEPRHGFHVTRHWSWCLERWPSESRRRKARHRAARHGVPGAARHRHNAESEESPRAGSHKHRPRRVAWRDGRRKARTAFDPSRLARRVHGAASFVTVPPNRCEIGMTRRWVSSRTHRPRVVAWAGLRKADSV